ncbi:sialidase family protein [Roseinatronobacter sp.]|uniref:sialidase family protein n=1 Tax=Roseinatronobacter sp. TaxID=1945755 RepID=UPI0025F64A1C|nr:exo-alpha-sialidase [Roseibaca sp.]
MLTPDQIAAQMTGMPGPLGPNIGAVLPSPCVQNHAAFLARWSDGALVCAWFGGSLEGKSDISIHAALLDKGSSSWGPSAQLSHALDRSEQNPVLHPLPNAEGLLFNTSQPAGNQDQSRVFMRHVYRDGNTLVAGEARDIGLPDGTFIRAPLCVRDDGAWMLPLFLCNPREGYRWTGAHDTAALAVSLDQGETWAVTHVPGSVGSVHMTPVDLGGGHMAAFYRRRQSDFVHRSESHDGGRTWSAPLPTDVPNNNSSIGVVRLQSGLLAMLCNPISAAQSASRRASLYDELTGDDTRPDAPDGCNPIWGVERAPLALCLSADEGRSFPYRHIIEDSPGTCLTNDSLDGRNKELSYPVVLQSEEGGLDMAYTLYRRAIRHVRLSADRVAAISAEACQQGVLS